MIVRRQGATTHSRTIPVPLNEEDAIHAQEDTRARFSDLPLSPPILQAVQNAGYETPSPIQAQAIPPLLEGSDLLGVAQTGTGKTAAFSLPLLSRIDESVKGPQILCLAPTRELALQVAEAIEGYAENRPKLRVVVVYGYRLRGTNPRVQAGGLCGGNAKTRTTLKKATSSWTTYRPGSRRG